MSQEQVQYIAAFLIGTEEKDLACRVILTCFELHFYSITNEEHSSRTRKQRR